MGILLLGFGAVSETLGQTTERVSVASDGSQAPPPSMIPLVSAGDSAWPSISADGRLVAFQSEAANFVPNDTNGLSDVFVHDRQTHETTRVSVASDGTQGNGASGFNPTGGSQGLCISADGRYVAFGSFARNLVSGDTNNTGDIFVHDRNTGQTARVSVASDGAQGNGASSLPSLSADGRYVAFDSGAANLVPADTNGQMDVFVHDRQTGQTTRVSVASDGSQADGFSWSTAISADGRFVAFTSEATNLVPGDTNGVRDIFVHDRQTGQTVRVSMASDGTQGDGPSGASESGGCVEPPAISADGRFVVFSSHATNLVPGDTNGKPDIFVHDRLSGQTSRVSVAPDGTQADDWSAYPAISANGRFVAFHSTANNLTSDPPDYYIHLFVHDRATGENTLASVASDGTIGNGNSIWGSLSADGRAVAFASTSSNLVPGDTNYWQDVFVRDRGAVAQTMACVDRSNATGVEDGMPWSPFDTLAEGIAAAPDGGTVKVAQRTYTGAVTLSGKAVTLQGGYPGGTYPGTGDFRDASRDPNPATNQTVLDGAGAPCAVTCQDSAARGSTLAGFTVRNGGAVLQGGVVLKRVIATSNP